MNTSNRMMTRKKFSVLLAFIGVGVVILIFNVDVLPDLQRQSAKLRPRLKPVADKSIEENAVQEAIRKSSETRVENNGIELEPVQEKVQQQTTSYNNSPQNTSLDIYIEESTSQVLQQTEEPPQNWPKCQPKKNLVFFKMHKCGSSTMQNILMRFGETRDLTFVLPPAGNYLGHGPFTSKAMMNFNVKEYNILCHHTRFSYKGMTAVMPKNTVFVTIIRDPATMFESHFTYNGYAGKYGIRNPTPLRTFLENPRRYYDAYGGKDHGKDPMLFDLGVENADKENHNLVHTKIEEFAKQFDIVLVTEYFKESLILLKELMCWDLDDIVHFVVNARSKESIKTVTDDMVVPIRSWNSGDTELYDFFNKTLWKKIKEFGFERMMREVQALNARNKYYQDKCISSLGKNLKGIWHPQGININGFTLKPEAQSDLMCVRMSRPELPYTSLLRDLQKQKYGIKSFHKK